MDFIQTFTEEERTERAKRLRLRAVALEEAASLFWQLMPLQGFVLDNGRRLEVCVVENAEWSGGGTFPAVDLTSVYDPAGALTFPWWTRFFQRLGFYKHLHWRIYCGGDNGYSFALECRDLEKTLTQLRSALRLNLTAGEKERLINLPALGCGPAVGNMAAVDRIDSNLKGQDMGEEKKLPEGIYSPGENGGPSILACPRCGSKGPFKLLEDATLLRRVLGFVDVDKPGVLLVRSEYKVDDEGSLNLRFLCLADTRDIGGGPYPEMDDCMCEFAGPPELMDHLVEYV